VVLNQDVVVAPGCVERLVGALDEAPAAMLATPKVLLTREPDRINACGNLPHYTGITVCRGYGRPAAAYSQIEAVGAISGAAFAARRDVFEILGGFDPALFLYLEDTDLSLRVILAGYQCLLVPEAVTFHDFEPRFAPEKLFWLERNRLAMLLKTYRWRTLTALAPALLLTEGLVVGYSVLHGQTAVVAKLRAYAWVVRHFRLILEGRRSIQARRRVSDRALLAHMVADLDLEELRHPVGRLAMRLVNPLFRAWLGVVRPML
jgi:GT2 family glycosyltransferase